MADTGKKLTYRKNWEWNLYKNLGMEQEGTYKENWESNRNELKKKWKKPRKNMGMDCEGFQKNEFYYYFQL